MFLMRNSLNEDEDETQRDGVPQKLNPSGP